MISTTKSGLEGQNPKAPFDGATRNSTSLGIITSGRVGGLAFFSESMTDKFPAKIIPNGNSKSVTIPYNIARKFELGEDVIMTIQKVNQS